MRFEPVLQLVIAFHPSPPCIQHQDREPQGAASQQITFNQLFPLTRDVLGNFRETIPREIYKTQSLVELEEIDRLRTAGPRTGIRQPVSPYQRINETGFADVASSQKRNFRLLFRRKLIWLRCTYYKPCGHPWVRGQRPQPLVCNLFVARLGHDLRRRLHRGNRRHLQFAFERQP